MYAPVRGPKTAVPLNEDLVSKVEAGSKWYKVGGRKGTIVREGKEMDSEKVKIIESGTVIEVTEEAGGRAGAFSAVCSAVR